jgi:hypothetical protein
MASWMNVPENIQRTQLGHILHNVLCLPNDPNKPVHIALTRARIRTLSYLVERPTADINALTCQPAGNDADGNAHPVQHLEDYLKRQIKQVIAHVLEENATFEILNNLKFDPRNVHIDTDSFGNFRLGRFTGAVTPSKYAASTRRHACVLSNYLEHACVFCLLTMI